MNRENRKRLPLSKCHCGGGGGGGKLSSRLTDGMVQAVSADLSDLYVSGEIGLMAITVDPAFANNRRLYTCQGHTGREVQVIA